LGPELNRITAGREIRQIEHARQGFVGLPRRIVEPELHREPALVTIPRNGIIDLQTIAVEWQTHVGCRIELHIATTHMVYENGRHHCRSLLGSERQGNDAELCCQEQPVAFDHEIIDHIARTKKGGIDAFGFPTFGGNGIDVVVELGIDATSVMDHAQNGLLLIAALHHYAAHHLSIAQHNDATVYGGGQERIAHP